MLEAEGYNVATLFINDDVAVKDSTFTVGRRGVAGNFFVMACGAGSERAPSTRASVKVNSVTRSMGIALTPCTPPAKGEPLFHLEEDEMEVGVGIHGEPGRRRDKLVSADEIVDELIEAIVPDLPYESGDEVALMINGLGGTPISELYLLYGIAHRKLSEHQGVAQLRRRVLHLAGDGGCLDDPGEGRRRDQGTAAGTCRDRHPHLLIITIATRGSLPWAPRSLWGLPTGRRPSHGLRLSRCATRPHPPARTASRLGSRVCLVIPVLTPIPRGVRRHGRARHHPTGGHRHPTSGHHHPSIGRRRPARPAVPRRPPRHRCSATGRPPWSGWSAC